MFNNTTSLSSEYVFHLNVINMDGNILDTIAYLIANMFKLENNLGISLIKNFVSNTYCVIEDKLLIDPSVEEALVCDYYFSVIRFEDQSKIIIFKSFSIFNT